MVPDASGSSRRRRERVRTTRACDRCKSRKARCTGQSPCVSCSRLGLSCLFTAPYTRGKPPVITPNRNSHAPTNASIYGSISTNDMAGQVAVEAEQSNPSIGVPSNIDHRPQELQHSTHHIYATAPDSRVTSPDPHQSTAEGHYIGPSSGLSALIRAQRRLRSAVPLPPDSSIFTFGDAPLPNIESSFLILPERAVAQKLLATYFDFAVPTHRFLHRPTTQVWLDNLYDLDRLSSKDAGSKAQDALVFMVLAQAKLYSGGVLDKDVDLNGSAMLFSASERQISQETGKIRLTSIQVRLAQCFYLLSQSRINQCWSLFGSTARLMLAIGLHRSRRHTSSNNVIEVECRKRVFWAAYSLDNYLGAALGRPRAFHDEDIDQSFPLCIDDSDLERDRVNRSTQETQSVMLAPLLHIRLSRIISGALRALYGVSRLDTASMVSTIANLSIALQEWRSSLPGFLNIGTSDLSLLRPPFSRQCTVLDLAYSHAVILVHRPLLLRCEADDGAQPTAISESVATAIRSSIQQCIGAASSIVKVVSNLCQGQRMFGAFWFTHYYAFCAITVLYVDVIQNCMNTTHDRDATFLAAQKCQDLLSQLATKSNFSKRYGFVLDELKVECIRQLRLKQLSGLRGGPRIVDSQSQNNVPGACFTTSSDNVRPHLDTGMQSITPRNGRNIVQTSFLTAGTEASTLEDMPGADEDVWLDENISSGFGDVSGWGELDSMVAAGFSAEFDPFIAEAADFTSFGIAIDG